MGDGMPTIVAKGFIGMRLDRRYATPERRWRSLEELRRSGWDGLAANTHTDALTSYDVATLTAQWFDTANDHWNALEQQTQPLWTITADHYVPVHLSQGALNVGRKVITAGLIEALEISLGLGHDESPPVLTLADDPYDKGTNKAAEVKQSGGSLIDVSGLTRNIPVDVYWVCGKLDGFEVQIAWNPQQVTVFILTPPVFWAINGANRLPYSHRNYEDAKRTDARGMVLVTPSTIADETRVIQADADLLRAARSFKVPASSATRDALAVNFAFAPHSDLISIRDGGVTPGSSVAIKGTP